jgi:hypothetical protein
MFTIKIFSSQVSRLSIRRNLSTQHLRDLSSKCSFLSKMHNSSNYNNKILRRFLSTKKTTTTPPPTEKKGWWKSAEWWGGMGALAGWGMTGAAIWDATNAGPELISLNMTSVMLVYSSLFARWAWVVKPQNLALCACHVSNVIAQSNQMRRAIEHKIDQGQEEEVHEMGMKAGAFVLGTGALIAGGPTLQAGIVGANLGPVSTLASAAAGPFTVHFWAPMSKWLISGASFLDLDRPTDKVSITQYTALTLTGFFFSRYAMLVSSIL